MHPVLPYNIYLLLRRGFIVLLLHLSFFPAARQLSFSHLTVESGLSGNSVLAITQDKKGFIWLGTRNGLNRYDGARFRLYLASTADSNSLSGNNVVALLCDSKSNLWVGSSGGLDCYDSTLDRFTRIRLGPRNNYSVTCLYEDSRGILWAGTTEGLYILDPQKKTVISSYTVAGTEGLAGNNVRCIFEDSRQTMWLGTSSGLTSMARNHNSYVFESYHHQPGNPRSLSADYITTIAEDKKARLWIGTQNNGINLLEPGASSFIRLTASGGPVLVNNNVRKIIIDKNGLLWIGTQEGLNLLEPETKKITAYQNDAGDPQSLSQNSIYSLYEDMHGSVWIGTYFGGANTTFSSTTRFRSFQKREDRRSISNNVVSSITEDSDNNLWIGTEGGGLNFFDRKAGIFSFYTHHPSDAGSLGSNLVKAVYIDKEQNIWCGTHGGGLNVLDRKKNRFTRYLYQENDAALAHIEITSLAEDDSGRFWAATNQGLLLFKKNGTQLEPVPLNTISGVKGSIAATYLYQSRTGALWIGASGGLYRVAGNQLYEANNELNINCIREDAQGNIWAGLSFGGLAKYDPQSGKLQRYQQNGVLKNRQIIGILDDEAGNLWLSTDKGLIKYDPVQESARIYTLSDGLPGNEFNFNSFLKDSRGEFFFGSYSGITSFYPQQIQTNQYVAPLVYTGLRLFNTPVSISTADGLLQQNITQTRQITFRYNQNVFTIEFALLNFIKSNKNKYACRLEGFDKEWNETANTSITYTNLPAGSYTLWIKGANNDGVWSEPAAMKIKILPPFWLTWWAYCIYTLVAAAILFLIIRFFFLRALLKKEEDLHTVKLNFFTNVSHEIRTHLTLIMAPVEKMLEQKEKEGFDHQQLMQIKSNANRLLKLVSELMDFRKAETDHLLLQTSTENIIPFLQEIYTSFRDISLAKNISMAFVHDAEEVMVAMDKEQLEKVFFNLLANAFKFTPEGGRILLSVVQEKNKALVQVTDNGRGIDPAYQQKLFTNFFQVADHGLQNTGYGIGLALSKKIVELHHGQIRVESEPAVADKAGRTCFTVTLPLAAAAHKTSLPAKQPETTGTAQQVDTVPVATVPAQPETVQDGTMPSLLLVEDNPDLRQLIAESFGHTYHILVAEDGQRGWEKAISEIPDIIISDVMMPVMDGFALCSKIKTDERTSHIPVILLTAKSTQSDQVSGLETGADSYITKPFSIKILGLQVHNLLQLRERMREHITSCFLQSRFAAKEEVKKQPDTGLRKIDQEFLNNIVQVVEEQMDNPDFGVEMLSRKVAMSAPVLYKKLKAVTGLSVNDFVKSLRLQKAAALLAAKELTVYEVAYAVGYSDRKYFSKEFKKQFGTTPTAYAAGQKNTS